MSATMQESDLSQSTTRNEEDIFKILVATDIHLGFEERDPIRDQDTFDTFEEILQIALNEEVDLVLLGGDLFHHARPSPYCIFKCTELLRKYCLGDRPVEIEFLSDPSQNFQNSSIPTVNYEDPNLNVSIPVFSIHGNHDDPTGQRQISAMDLMATTGLVNYFGRWHSHERVDIEPILLKKGESKLALYGLSHIKDERLGRLFLDKKVKMMAPEDKAEWFNLLVWHQNRAMRGVKNFIPDGSLPNFLDLVIWGHEHDCRISPERRPSDIFISQPGSSVATSLVAGEAIPKKVGILKIHKKDFFMMPIELKTVRPFIFDELVLKDLDDVALGDSALTHSELAMNIVKEKVDHMIEAAKQLGRTGKASEKPLIRLNVKYKDERQVFNAIRFGQSYVGKVANPEDIVKCQAIKQPVKRSKTLDDVLLDEGEILADRVEDIVLKHFSENDLLKCFPVYSLNEAVKKYIDSNDTEAPSLVSDHLMNETIKKLEEDMPEIEEVDACIQNFKIAREQESVHLVYKVLNDPSRPKKRNTSNEENEDANRTNGRNQSNNSDDEAVKIFDSDDDMAETKPARGRGSRGGRVSRAARGTRTPRRAARGRGK